MNIVRRYRILRGGSWHDAHNPAACSSCSWYRIAYRLFNIGVRLSRTRNL